MSLKQKQSVRVMCGLSCGLFTLGCSSSDVDPVEQTSSDPSSFSIQSSRSSSEPRVGTVYTTLLPEIFKPDETIARFLAPHSNPRDCETQTLGDCAVTTCAESEDSDPEPEALDAGTIAISRDGEPHATLEPDADGIYHEELVDQKRTLGGGEQLQISAEGGDIEAFSVDLKMPLAPRLLSHDHDGDQGRSEFSVSAGEDLKLEWDARGNTGTLEILTMPSLDRDDDASGEKSPAWVSCSFEITDGQGTIAKEALAHLTRNQELHLIAANQEHVSVEQGYVQVATLMTMVGADKQTRPIFIVE